MLSNHVILCCPLLFSIFPRIRVFSNESALCIRRAKYWNFSFNISSFNEYSGLISFRIDWIDLPAVQGTLKSLLQHHSLKAPAFCAQPSLWSEGNGNRLQYSCLENSMNRGDWWATVYGVAKSWTQHDWATEHFFFFKENKLLLIEAHQYADICWSSCEKFSPWLSTTPTPFDDVEKPAALCWGAGGLSLQRYILKPAANRLQLEIVNHFRIPEKKWEVDFVSESTPVKVLNT